MVEFSGLIAEQDAFDELRQGLAALLDPGDTGVVLTASMLWAVSGYQLRVLNPDGDLESSDGRYRAVRMPIAVIDALEKLREVAYREEVGTWYSIRVTVNAAGSTTAEYNYDNEPEWFAPPDPEAYLTDLERYPRAPEHQPEWLKAKIEDASRRKPL